MSSSLVQVRTLLIKSWIFVNPKRNFKLKEKAANQRIKWLEEKTDLMVHGNKLAEEKEKVNYWDLTSERKNIYH